VERNLLFDKTSPIPSERALGAIGKANIKLAAIVVAGKGKEGRV
jgi:hypothetical protein